MKAIDVSAALVFRDGKLLIALRHDDAHLGGLWEFPGGKREPTETFEQCLVRELREELGIEVQVGELIESLTHEYSDRMIFLKFFRCDWRKNEPQTLGCAAFAWVLPAQLASYAFPPADARLLERLARDRSLWNAHNSN